MAGDVSPVAMFLKNIAFNHPFGIALLATSVIVIMGVPFSVYDTMQWVTKNKHEIVHKNRISQANYFGFSPKKSRLQRRSCQVFTVCGINSV